MTKITYKEESYKIIGACFEVYNEKGHGFLEAVYQECLKMEFIAQQIPFIEKSKLELDYKGQLLKQTYEPDFVCYSDIILELKSVKELSDKHRAQLYNYLKATQKQLGILINFGSYPNLEHERIVL